MTIDTVARAFARKQAASCHNAKTDGQTYWLHGHAIATHTKDDVRYSWCDHYTRTTANHLNKIRDALDIWRAPRFSYAAARDSGETGGSFFFR